MIDHPWDAPEVMVPAYATEATSQLWSFTPAGVWISGQNAGTATPDTRNSMFTFHGVLDRRDGGVVPVLPYQLSFL